VQRQGMPPERGGELCQKKRVEVSSGSWNGLKNYAGLHLMKSRAGRKEGDIPTDSRPARAMHGLTREKKKG